MGDNEPPIGVKARSRPYPLRWAYIRRMRSCANTGSSTAGSQMRIACFGRCCRLANKYIVNSNASGSSSQKQRLCATLKGIGKSRNFVLNISAAGIYFLSV